MFQWFAELPVISQAILAYLLFMLVLVAWFVYEIRKSPTYLDDDMRHRAPDDEPVKTPPTRYLSHCERVKDPGRP